MSLRAALLAAFGRHRPARRYPAGMLDGFTESAGPAEMPHARYPHVYAIVRHDGFHESSASPQVVFTVTKVFGDRGQAEREAERLNQLQQERGVACCYWVQITRFVPVDAEEA